MLDLETIWKTYRKQLSGTTVFDFGLASSKVYTLCLPNVGGPENLLKRIRSMTLTIQPSQFYFLRSHVVVA